MWRLLVLALISALLLVGCGGGGGIPKERLSALVLRRQDVGTRFAVFYSGRQTQLDNQGTPRSDGSRFGREGGWIARFRRSGAGAAGPLVIESRADLFSGSGGAGNDLDLYSRLIEGPGYPLKVPKLGDGAVGSTFVQPGGKPLRFYVIAWRYRNATASVTVEGFDGHVRSRDAIRLARRQQARLAAA
jgi:hypothetical protein